MRIFFAAIYLLLIFCSVVPVNAGFHFAGKDSRLRIKDPGAKFVLNAPIVDFQGTLEIADSVSVQSKAIGASSSQLIGQPIIFSSGIVERNGASASWTGRFDSSSNGHIMLQGSSKMRAQPGVWFDGMAVSGSDNLIEGTPKFSAPIVLADNSSELKFSIQNKLNHHVHLNDGKITLEDDLSIGDDVMLHGSGIVDINSHTLNFPGRSSTWGGSLQFLSATDMILNAALTLTGAWYFGPDNSLAELQGNGNVLDLSNGGSLVVQAGVGLGLTDVVIKGLSSTQGTIVMCDVNSTLSLSNAVLQLSGAYSFTQGNLYFYGANSMIVTGSNVLTIGNAVAKIDATTLEYDTLSLPDTHPIVPCIPDGVHLITVNNGRLMTRPSGTSYGFVLYMDNPCYTQVRNESFDSINRTLNFRGNNASNITWDGAGHTMQFARGAALANSLVIGINKTVTLKNVVLKDFSSLAVSLGGGSLLVFGDGVTIELGANESLSTTWAFTGQSTPSTICGNGHSLNLASLYEGYNVAISVGAGQGGSPVTLNIENTHLTGLSGGVALDTLVSGMYTYSTAAAYAYSTNLLRCVDYTGVINLRNTDLNLSGNYTITAGSINIYNDVAIRGKGYTFAFSSNGTLAIKSGSTLLIDRNVTLSYDSSGLGNVGGGPSKNQLTMDDQTSRLYLNGCTLYGTHTSPSFQTGVIVVSDKVTFSSEGVVDSEAIVLNSTSGLLVEVLAASTMDVSGALAHQ